MRIEDTQIYQCLTSNGFNYKNNAQGWGNIGLWAHTFYNKTVQLLNDQEVASLDSSAVWMAKTAREFLCVFDGKSSEYIIKYYGIKPKEDPVNNPTHYKHGAIECIDAIKSQLGHDGFIAYLRGTIAKYNWRLLHKDNPLQDAEKMEFYINRLIVELKDVK